MYDVHLGLMGKRVMDFLFVSIELFSLGVTAEAIRVKIDRKSAISLPRGEFDPKFQVEGDVRFCMKIWRILTDPLSKLRFSISLFTRSASDITPSEKSSISTIRNPLRAFQ